MSTKKPSGPKEYVCVEKCFVDNEIYNPGDTVFYDGVPGSALMDPKDGKPAEKADIVGATPKGADSPEEWVEKVTGKKSTKPKKKATKSKK